MILREFVSLKYSDTMSQLDDSVLSLLSLSSSGDLDNSVDIVDEHLNLSSTSIDLNSSIASLSGSDHDAEDPQDGTYTNVLGLDPNLRKALHEESTLSTWDSYLHIMRYLLRYSLSKKAVSELLSLVGLHLPTSSSPSFYKFKKTFLDFYEDISFNTHYCFSNCHSPFEDRHSQCPSGCSADAAEFLTISVEAQLKRKLQSKFIVKCVSL